MRRFYEPAAPRAFMIARMSKDNDRHDDPTRVLSLTLAETEWRKLMDVEPEPIAWLREQIRERIDNRAAGTVSLPPGSQPEVVCGLS